MPRLIFSIITLGLLSCCQDNTSCGDFPLELSFGHKIVYVDTATLNLEYDAIGSYYKQYPNIIRFLSGDKAITVFIYIGRQEDILSMIDIYDFEEIYSPLEDQVHVKPWNRFLDKGKFENNGLEIAYVNYVANTTNLTHAQITFGGNLYGHVIIVNNAQYKSEQVYAAAGSKFLSGICLKNN